MRPGSPSINPLAAGWARVWAAGDACAQMAAAVEWANSIDPKHFRAFLQNLHRLPAHAGKELAARTLLNRWVALDPEAALRWGAENDPDRITDLSGEWIRRDPAQVDAILSILYGYSERSGNPYRNLKTSAFVGIFGVLASADRKAAMAFLDHPEVVRDVTRLVPQLRVFAREDPEWVLQWAEKLGNTNRASVRKAAVRAMADTDAPAAVAWARQQPDRETMLEAMLRDPKDAPSLVAALSSLPVDEQAGLRNNNFSIWGTGDPGAVVEALEKARGRLSPEALEGMLRVSTGSLLRASDPGALADRLLAITGEHGGLSVVGFASSYARQSPEAARAWAAALDDETLRRSALEAVEKESQPLDGRPSLTLEERTVKAAANGNVGEPQVMMAMDEAARRRVLEAALARDLAAPRAVGGETPGSLDDSSALGKLAHYYPAETARLLADQLAPESTPTIMGPLARSAAYWASEDPTAAAAWARSLPPGEARAWAAVNVFEQWTQFDTTAASKWWESLPVEERKLPQRDPRE
ncbi:MAG: hypothetical protein ACKV19_20485 [Verrucomicrobiales bacterium]